METLTENQHLVLDRIAAASTAFANAVQTHKITQTNASLDDVLDSNAAIQFLEMQFVLATAA